MIGYRPPNFELRELIPPQIHVARGDRAWQLLDVRALMTLQALRDKFGPLVVNDWHIGGRYRESGLRSFTTSTGAVWSQHRYGRAFDCKFKECKPFAVAEYVMAHQDEYPHLTTIENTIATPTWFHFDVRAHDHEGIWIVDP